MGIQKAFELGPSNFLTLLEKELTMQYSAILKQGDLFWYQKLRAQ